MPNRIARRVWGQQDTQPTIILVIEKPLLVWVHGSLHTAGCPFDPGEKYAFHY